MWINIIGPYIAKGPMGLTSKNQVNHPRMDLNGLPNIVKKGEISEKEVIIIFFFPPSGLLLYHAIATKSTRNIKLQRQKESTRKPRRSPHF